MICLTDTPPSHCPQCAKACNYDMHSSEDFYAGASSECACGAKWQYVDTQKLIDTSTHTPKGDLARYL